MKTGSQGGREEGRKSLNRKKTNKNDPPSPPLLPVKKNSGDSISSESVTHVVDQLRALEDARKDGAIELPGGERLNVTNLAKPFWPKLKLTKGDLLRYYATVAPLLLPAVADRPLVMKRFPNGVDGPAFYQQRASRGETAVRRAHRDARSRARAELRAGRATADRRARSSRCST